MNKKAQIGTNDLFIALAIFLITIIALVALWNKYNVLFNQNIEDEEMFSLGIQITDLMVKSPGIPSNWNISNAQTIGLATNDHNLSIAKVSNFTQMNYTASKRLLKLTLYDYVFRISTLNGTILVNYGNMYSNANKVVNIRRLVLYQNESILELIIWK